MSQTRHGSLGNALEEMRRLGHTDAITRFFGSVRLEGVQSLLREFRSSDRVSSCWWRVVEGRMYVYQGREGACGIAIIESWKDETPDVVLSPEDLATLIAGTMPGYLPRELDFEQDGQGRITAVRLRMIPASNLPKSRPARV